MSKTAPLRIALWILLGSFVALLIVVLRLALTKEGSVFGGVLYSVFVTSWVCSPLSVAVVFVDREPLLWTRWAFLIGVVIIASSNAALLFPLFLYPEPGNAFGLAILPFLQGAGLLAYAVLVWLLRVSLAERQIRGGEEK